MGEGGASTLDFFSVEQLKRKRHSAINTAKGILRLIETATFAGGFGNWRTVSCPIVSLLDRRKQSVVSGLFFNWLRRTYKRQPAADVGKEARRIKKSGELRVVVLCLIHCGETTAIRRKLSGHFAARPSGR